MELLEKFKNHLLSQKNASKITVKNYLADVRKFIRWFEVTYQTSFTASVINSSLVEQYTKEISTNAPRSVKRYTSSLKKFFAYLKTQGLITTNPLEINTEEKKNDVDPWLLREFKNYLFNSKASALTIKNYMIDVQQFLTWVYEITNAVAPVNNRASILGKINTELVETYKNRLLEEAQLSPVSVNRKLSSLRKYIGWITEKGVLQEKPTVTTAPTPQIAPEQKEEPIDVQPVIPLTLESLETLTKPNDQEEEKKEDSDYSKIAFIRFGQKVEKGISLLFDWIVIIPFSKTIAAGKYHLWKKSSKEVFTPLQEVVKAYGETIPEQIKAVSPIEQISTGAKTAAMSLSILDKLLGVKRKTTIGRIKNIPKSIYAPLQISTTHLPWSKKIMHFLRHRRPKWYKKYHSYSFVHYVHFAVLLIFVTTIGFSFYRAFFDTPHSQKPALAALPTAPPRILSFQGRLTDASSTPITADTPLRFGIYNSQTASGSALLWQEVQTVSPDEDGIFSVLLGSNNPLSQGLFANNAGLYLGVTVNADNELTPRQQLATVAYAANAETLQGLLPITKPNAGTANVILALDSSGNLTIGGSANPTFQATGGQFSLLGQTLFLGSTSGSNGSVVISPDGSGVIDLQKPLQNTSNYNNIASARGAVEVDDLFAILATSSGQSALTVNQNSTGPIISASAGGIAKFTVSNAGAGTFASDIGVNGNNITTTSNSFNLLNTTATTINFGGAATSLSIGASSGTTEINNNLEVNGTTTLGGTTYSWPSSQSNGAVLQTNGSGQLSWVSIGSITNGWQALAGALSPTIITNDFLIGGSATSSAKFQVSGTNGNVSTVGTFTFNGAGNIQTNASQQLTIGGNTTGNIILSPINGTGTVTFAGYSSGILRSNSSGVLSSSAVNLSSSDVTGALTVTNGGTGITSIGSAGSIAYSNGSTYGFTGVGSAGQCLQSSGAGAPVWGSCDSANTYWQESNGALAPGNNTTDFLLGGTSSASAKFAFLNVNTDTPTASISANNGANATYLTGSGVLGTTNAQTLTLGSATTGNISLVSGGTTALTAFANGQIGIGTTTPLATLDVRGTTGTAAVASVSGQTTAAAFVVDNNGTGDLFSASKSGLTRFTIGNGGGLTLNAEGLNSFATVNQLDATITKDSGLAFGTMFRTYAAQTGSSSVSQFSHYNNLEYAATSSTNQSGDLVASLDQVNWRGTGNSTGRLIGSIGKIVSYTGSGTIDNAIASLADATFDGGTVGNFYGNYIKNPTGSSTVNNTYGVYIENMTKGSTNNFALYAAGGKNYFGGHVGVGTTTPLAAVDIRGLSGITPVASVSGQTSFAAMVVDNSGFGDIFTASSGGQTKFAIKQDGSTQIYLNTQIGSGGQRLCHSGADGSNQGLVTLADCNTTNADYAEAYGTNNPAIEAGDIVTVDPERNAEEVISNGNKTSKAWITKSNKAYQKDILGIVSTNPHEVIGKTFTPEENPRPVALTGRVPVKIASSSSEIKPGDYLTSSQTPGQAMKATRPGHIIGKALETWKPNSNKGTVLVFVQNGWNNPYIAITDEGNITVAKDAQTENYVVADKDGTIESVGIFSDATAAHLTAGLLEAQELVTKTLSVDSLMIQGKSLQEYILATMSQSIQNPANQMSLVQGVTEQPTQLTTMAFPTTFSTPESRENVSSTSALAKTVTATDDLQTQNASLSGTLTATEASISGTLRADRIIAGTIEGLEFDRITDLTTIYNNSATPSALATPSANTVPLPALSDSEVDLIKQMIYSPLSPFNASSAAELNIDSLEVDTATISHDLNVLGKTTVNDLGITGNITAGVLSIHGLDDEGEASINTLAGDLKIQSEGTGGVDILAGKFTIDTKGNVNVQGNATFAKDVTVKGKLQAKDIKASGTGSFVDIATNALKIVRGAQADTSATETSAEGTAGTTVIKANKTERTIVSPHVGKDSLIYITATSNTQGVMPYVARQTAEETKTGTKGSFTIEIPNTVKKDIKINWWIVN